MQCSPAVSPKSVKLIPIPSLVPISMPISTPGPIPRTTPSCVSSHLPSLIPIAEPSTETSHAPGSPDSDDNDITISNNEDEYVKFDINRIPISPRGLLYCLAHPTQVQFVSTHSNHTKCRQTGRHIPKSKHVNQLNTS